MKPFAIHLHIRPKARGETPWVVCAAEPGENQDIDARVFVTACGAAAAMVVSKCLKAERDNPGLPGAELIDLLADAGLIPRDIPNSDKEEKE